MQCSTLHSYSLLRQDRLDEQLKRLDIIIPHENLVDVNKLLHKHRVGGMSFYEIKGRGRAKQETVSVGRGVMRYVPKFGYRTKIEVVVSDALAKAIVNDVLKILGARSSSVGKIFVYDVKEAYDLGTKEEGNSAL